MIRKLFIKYIEPIYKHRPNHRIFFGDPVFGDTVFKANGDVSSGFMSGDYFRVPNSFSGCVAKKPNENWMGSFSFNLKFEMEDSVNLTDVEAQKAYKESVRHQMLTFFDNDTSEFKIEF